MLRARVKGLPTATIAQLYLDADNTEPLEGEHLQRTMRGDLVARAAGQSVVILANVQASMVERREQRMPTVSAQRFEQVVVGGASGAMLVYPCSLYAAITQPRLLTIASSPG
ncbi:hypothetical protein [Burkholderia ubonensis]|uniref:hypothetical protein n=1 Tax=Burkholderia ubonensis TaxID=101571 RepID=UPI001054C7BD|nr:hypothetical protein [Burkholderia ubonensis]